MRAAVAIVVALLALPIPALAQNPPALAAGYNLTQPPPTLVIDPRISKAYAAGALSDAELAAAFDSLIDLLKICEVMRSEVEANSAVGIGGVNAGWVVYFETCTDQVRTALFLVAAEAMKRNRSLPGQGVIARLDRLDAFIAGLRKRAGVVLPDGRRVDRTFKGTDEEKQALIAWLTNNRPGGSATTSSKATASGSGPDAATPRPEE